MPARDIPCEVDVTSKYYVSEVCLTYVTGFFVHHFATLRQNVMISTK